jgi:lysozyme
MIDQIKERIKLHEGFRDTIYKDSLGKMTIGWGHLVTPQDKLIENVQYSKEFLNNLFEKDFQRAYDEAEDLLKGINIVDEVAGVIIEMVFQLGKQGVSKFKKMFEALAKQDYESASNEMLSSAWAKQTPERCQELSSLVKNCQN